ncbi:MAG: sensor histidine kinase [Planctomycetota bacterium]|jgi:signal transduction histidine kinase
MKQAMLGLGLLVAGLAAWVAVAVPVMLMGVTDAPVAWWIAWAVFGIAFLAQDWGQTGPDGGARALVALAVQVIAAAASNWLVPAAMPGVAIGGALFVITAARAVPVLPVAGGAALVLAQTVFLGFAYHHAAWPTSIMITSALAFLGLQLFGLGTAVMADRERRATARLAATLDQLRVARALLAEGERREVRSDVLRDLHDSAGHHLTALVLHLQAAAAAPEDERAAAVRTSETIARALLGEIRQFVASRRVDLRGDLERLVSMTDDAYGRGTVEAEIDDELPVPDPAVAEVAYRTAQEGLTNAVRHAHARSIRLACRRDDGTLTVRVADDGRGARGAAPGSGLGGLRDRVEHVGGTLHTGDVHGGGFEIVVTLPLGSGPA